MVLLTFALGARYGLLVLCSLLPLVGGHEMGGGGQERGGAFPRFRKKDVKKHRVVFQIFGKRRQTTRTSKEPAIFVACPFYSRSGQGACSRGLSANFLLERVKNQLLALAWALLFYKWMGGKHRWVPPHLPQCMLFWALELHPLVSVFWGCRHSR